MVRLRRCLLLASYSDPFASAEPLSVFALSCEEIKGCGYCEEAVFKR